MDYRISGERLKGFADQVRRISGVEGELTPEQMETNLLNVTPLGEYPKAEEGAFGEDSNSVFTGVTVSDNVVIRNSSKTYAIFHQFKAKQAFAIQGLRIYHSANSYKDYTVYLRNENGEIVRTVTFSGNPDNSGWNNCYFDKPVNVAIDEVFYLSTAIAYYYYCEAIYITANDKVTWVGSVADTSVNVPTSGWVNSWYNGLIDFIGSEITGVELPDHYQIQRTTMDDIAEEVQRISGATTKLSTAQIISGLSEVEVLEDYEEVAF